MSIYRKIERVPVDDLHYFERQRGGSGRSLAQDESDWLPKRKALPYDKLLATTESWRAALPLALRPKALCEQFPRIANGLATGWRDSHATMRYFEDLLTDRRAGRKGFPADVVEELHALKAFYEALHPSSEGWRRS